MISRHNIRTVADVPLRLSGQNFPDVLEVRGEVYMTNADLVALKRAAVGARRAHLCQYAKCDRWQYSLTGSKDLR